MSITALAGGIGGARFLRGLLHAVPDADITVIGNVADDITLHGLHVSPDLDTVMYTLGGGINEEQGWGREDETFSVAEELAAYGAHPQWFTLGDRDIATHIVRTQMLSAGYPLSAVTEALCDRWRPGVRLLPVTDERVETHVVVADDTGMRAIHFQEWWVRWHARIAAARIMFVGIDSATPAPGVIEAITNADVVILPPSNPVVSIGPILSVPGVREAVASTDAPVVGLSPIIGAAPVRGMAGATLRSTGVEVSAAGVAGMFRDILDGWLVDTSDADSVAGIEALRTEGHLRCRAVPLLMHDVEAAAAMAREALDLAWSSRRQDA
ncbi:2-phospho-L-lactate transferase [Actinobacteria bacterium YIM 96077]|uniref:2-phospho-L-lactate transferase n=1 Tax=Phytoactinopolyspora halophila TaxID=1981511 RepID=A0A329R7A5_9ACTN|nr:2-phospho-L-lactate transferase [Actinobacteria bacterium YIM 96077]RAW18978.1 2-phospho-L-lactate transferase [Phytoactinopolyspora halophila]